MSMNGHDASKDPRNKLFDGFFKRMEAKKAEDARQEAEVRAIERDIEQRRIAEEAEESDRGARDFVIGNQDGRVLVEFPESVTWLGFTPEEAVIVAQALTENAAAALRWVPPEPPAEEPTPT